jgi:glycosyltransferase involved in cell wall biosynthesis
MRIALVLSSLSYKGPNIVAFAIAKFLHENNHIVHVYYFKDDPAPYRLPCKVRQVKLSTSLRSYDVVHSHTLLGDVYLFLMRLISPGQISVTTIHQDPYSSFKYTYNRFIALILSYFWLSIQRRFHGVVAISHYIKQLSGIFSSIVIYNGCDLAVPSTIDDDLVRSLTCMRNDGFKIIGTYAFIRQIKGISQVLRALQYLPGFIFVIIGSGPYCSSLLSEASALGLSDRVLFAGEQEAPYFYTEFFDVFVVPSYSEGFCLSAVEAAMCNNSIVCSDIPVFREIFNSFQVTYFKLDDPMSLSSAIEFAYDNRFAHAELVRSYALSKFTANKMAEQYQDYYKSLI